MQNNGELTGEDQAMNFLFHDVERPLLYQDQTKAGKVKDLTDTGMKKSRIFNPERTHTFSSNGWPQ